MKSCVAPVCFRLAAPGMDASFPPVLAGLRAAIPLSFVLILRLGGATPVAELATFWRCPLRLVDELLAFLCRSCESRSVSWRRRGIVGVAQLHALQAAWHGERGPLQMGIELPMEAQCSVARQRQ